MSYVMRTITSYTDEWGFIQAFINSVLSADTNITLETDMDELEEEFSDSSAVPAFTFNIGGMYTITFTRRAAISSGVSSYYVTSDAASDVQIEVYFRDNGQDAAAVVKRSLRYMVISNPYCINFRIAGYTYSDLRSQSQISYIGFREGTAIATGYVTNGSNILAATFYLNDENSTPVVKTNRLPYIYDEMVYDSIELIKNKTFLTSGTIVKKLNVNAFYDISKAAKDVIYTIGGKTYYSLDEHTIMEV